MNDCQVSTKSLALSIDEKTKECKGSATPQRTSTFRQHIVEGPIPSALQHGSGDRRLLISRTTAKLETAGNNDDDDDNTNSHNHNHSDNDNVARCWLLENADDTYCYWFLQKRNNKSYQKTHLAHIECIVSQDKT